MELELDHLDDGGMYVWAGIVAIVALGVAFGVAVWWQRWREQQKSASGRGPD